MIEKMGWDYFVKTGNIDGYLLYKQSMNTKENSGDYGTNQNQRDRDQTNPGERQ